MVSMGTGGLLLVFGCFGALFSLLHGMITKVLDSFRYLKREDKRIGTRMLNVQRSTLARSSLFSLRSCNTGPLPASASNPDPVTPPANHM